MPSARAGRSARRVRRASSDAEIHVENIDRCQARSDLAKTADPSPDYSGPGLYLMPLQAVDANNPSRFEVVPTSPSPGFPIPQGVKVGPPRIYPATPEMLAEYRAIAKP